MCLSPLRVHLSELLVHGIGVHDIGVHELVQRTRTIWKDRCIAGLQFYKIGFDPKRNCVVISDVPSDGVESTLLTTVIPPPQRWVWSCKSNELVLKKYVQTVPNAKIEKEIIANFSLKYFIRTVVSFKICFSTDAETKWSKTCFMNNKWGGVFRNQFLSPFKISWNLK